MISNKSSFSIQIIMINPFISNNDGDYLFRKNYQLFAKPQSPPPLQPYSSAKLGVLQSKNPFAVSSTPSFIPPAARSLSNSRIGLSSPQTKQLLGKSRLLQEVDSWKRDIEGQERQKLQAYGAQGLRYNAFTPNSYKERQKDTSATPLEPNSYISRFQARKQTQQTSLNQYYTYSKPQDQKSSKFRESGHLPMKQQTYTWQQPKDKINQQNIYSKRPKQHFTDELDDLRPQPTINRQRNKYQLDIDPIREQSHYKSKLDDMFGSKFQDRFKQSMQHQSYASYYGDDLIESKRFKNKQQPHRLSRFEQSAVKTLENFHPTSLTYQGKVYYKLEVRQE